MLSINPYPILNQTKYQDSRALAPPPLKLEEDEQIIKVEEDGKKRNEYHLSIVSLGLHHSQPNR